MIDIIQPKIVRQISDATRQERCPGEISTGVRRTKGLFSRIVDKIKETREK